MVVAVGGCKKLLPRPATGQLSLPCQGLASLLEKLQPRAGPGIVVPFVEGTKGLGDGVTRHRFSAHSRRAGSAHGPTSWLL